MTVFVFLFFVIEMVSTFCLCLVEQREFEVNSLMYNWVATRIRTDAANLGFNRISLTNWRYLCHVPDAFVYSEVTRFTGRWSSHHVRKRERKDCTATSYESLILLSGHTQHIKAVKSLLGTFVLPQGLWNWQQWCYWSAAVSLHGPCQIRMAKGP